MSEIKITLEKRHIVNDVSAECNLLGRTIEVSGKGTEGGNALRELAGYIKSVSDDETKPIVARAMGEAYTRVKEACQRFLQYGRCVDDNRLESMFVYADRRDVTTELFLASTISTPGSYRPVAGLQHEAMHLGSVSLEDGGQYRLDIPLSRATYAGGSGTFHLYVGTKEIASFIVEGAEDVTIFFSSDETAVRDVYLGVDISAVGLPTFTGGSLTVSCSKRAWGKYELNLTIDNFDEGVTGSITSYAHRLIVDYVIAAILKNQRAEDYAKYYASSQSAYDSLVRILQARKTFGRQAHDWM